MDGSKARARVLGIAVSAGIVAGVAIGIATFALFQLLAWASLSTPRDALARPIARAFATGDLRPSASWAFGDTDIGVHQYNDCLVLFQALDDRAPRTLRAVSPLSVAGDAAGPCAHLQRLATGGPDTPPRFYHHYLHAATSVTRLLLPLLGVRGVRGTYRLLASLLLLAGLGYAMLGLARGQGSASHGRAVNAVWLIVFAAFARGFGLEAFGQSLSHGPADLTVLAYLLVLARASASRPIAAPAAIAVAAAFGALTIEFELLTGGLPLGLAVVIGTTPFAVADADGRRTIAAAIAYLAAAATCFLAKFGIVLALFGRAPLADAGAQILFRAGVSATDTAARDQPAGPAEFARRTQAGLDSLMPGLPWLATGLLALAVVGGLWGYLVLRRDADPAERTRAAALAASAIVPAGWMVALWQHTAEHAWFIDRILVWLLASGAALFFLAVRPGRSAPVQRVPGAGSDR